MLSYIKDLSDKGFHMLASRRRLLADGVKKQDRGVDFAGLTASIADTLFDQRLSSNTSKINDTRSELMLAYYIQPLFFVRLIPEVRHSRCPKAYTPHEMIPSMPTRLS